MLGMSEGTSKSQVHKARMRIRSYLAHGVRSEMKLKVESTRWPVGLMASMA